MAVLSSSPECGKRLRAERERLQLSLRQVEALSRIIADRWRSSDFYIAHASLADIENGKLAPNLYKLYSLSVIYGQEYDQLAAACGVPISEARKDQNALALPSTYLIGQVPFATDPSTPSAVELREKLRVERTNLMTKILRTWDEVPIPLQQLDGPNPMYGYIGMDDYTLHPFIRPGSFVRIDPRQKKISGAGWLTDHDRPIFFLELRERYVCSWCEMHQGRLIVIPSQQSRRPAQHLRYPLDVTIVGRVTGVTMNLFQPPQTELLAYR